MPRVRNEVLIYLRNKDGSHELDRHETDAVEVVIRDYVVAGYTEDDVVSEDPHCTEVFMSEVA